MRPTEEAPARKIAEASEAPEKEEEPALSSASNAIMEKLRRQRESLANVVKAQSTDEEPSEEGEEAPRPKPVARPAKPRAVAPPSVPGATFDSAHEWFAAKERQPYMFTRFAFRLTPDEKKVKDYLVGAGEFARKTFVPRSGLMEMRVRLNMSDDQAVAMIWEWLKRGIIEEAPLGTREEEA
jgi:hypothetical protein